ncbi:S-adenosyl-L-methionine-dependent methyltransferase [Lophiotrema nucula]|uniref:S-adenosyl-L-methionine-dependent methyltransferase n=1 Tax=Lophiotrema nucula TaxID=690887 RepID=A0A6A5ZMZ6_9PLEO|nr:S-adenosyl-L-methionine-dependent methyltransferase [Lophiotrema nucula]
MSLYYEAADVLANTANVGGSLKSRIYKKSDRKSSPAQLYALVTEAAKWSPVLKVVIEKSGLLEEEKKLTPVLALLLTHDLLVSKGGVAAPANHVLKLAITRHKARLGAEFTKARISGGYTTLAAFKNAVNDGKLNSEEEPTQATVRHPRWVRVNSVKTTLEDQLATTFAGFEKKDDLRDILSAPGSAKVYHIDSNIPHLLAFPSRIDLSKSPAYAKGQIIFQDKASCFPAYLLDPTPEDGDVIDGCAAPGNKTTHLAAILQSRTSHRVGDARTPSVIAFEKDNFRAGTLTKMVKLASADSIVTVKAGQDFLLARPDSTEFANVGAILLDPSCSGSGIVGRDDTVKMHLPEGSTSERPKGAKGKKRKRGDVSDKATKPSASLRLDLEDTTPEDTPEEIPIHDRLGERLVALSTFQLKILAHAMRFPNARKITYSTCSVHFEENEGVVSQALLSSAATQGGWTIQKRKDQVAGLKNWRKRGIWEEHQLESSKLGDHFREDVLDACIRCEKGTNEGTMGFFVAAFVRHGGSYSLNEGRSINEAVEEPTPEEELEEWNGFSDEDTSEAKKRNGVNEQKASEHKAKKNKKRRKSKTSCN